MINVGREFEIDKTRWRSYTAGLLYRHGHGRAAVDTLIVLYYVFVLLPPELWTSGEAWKENLLLSRFRRRRPRRHPFFTMLAASVSRKAGFTKRYRCWPSSTIWTPSC